MKFLGLDFGEKRIGVAVSDPLEVTARGLTVIERTDLPHDLQRIAQIAGDTHVDAIVIGLPLELDGAEGDPVRRVRTFAGRVRQSTGLPVHMWDERLTTVEAEENLRERGVDRGERRLIVDQVAAAAILQHFLDERARERSPVSEEE